MKEQKNWYQIGIAALPLGFVVLGIISMALFFLRADDGNAKPGENAENAAIFRKAIAKADLEAYVKMLSETIGELLR